MELKAAPSPFHIETAELPPTSQFLYGFFIEVLLMDTYASFSQYYFNVAFSCHETTLIFITPALKNENFLALI